MIKSKSVQQPVFILASPYSFTSIVSAMLGQHPMGYSVPEVNLFVTETMDQFEKMSIGKRRVSHGLLRTIAQLYSGEQSLEAIEMARRWITNRRKEKTSDVYIELSRKIAPLRIIDKCPLYTNPQKPDILKRIEKTFPKAHFVYLVRHPRSHGQSWQKIPEAGFSLIADDSVDYATDPPTIDPQFDWLKRQRHIMEFLATIPKARQIQLRGEDVLNDPRSYLERICNWLKFDWNDSIFDDMLHTERSSYASMGPFGAEWGNNPSYQKNPAFRHRPIKISKLGGRLPWRNDKRGFIPEVIELAQELGYE